MRLVLTQYLDADPVDVADRLEGAVVDGLDAAAARIAMHRHDVVTEFVDQGLRVHRGLEVLDGSELRVSGGERFTTLEIVVPWTSEDPGAKLLAANAFANTVAHHVRTAA